MGEHNENRSGIESVDAHWMKALASSVRAVKDHGEVEQLSHFEQLPGWKALGDEADIRGVDSLPRDAKWKVGMLASLAALLVLVCVFSGVVKSTIARADSAEMRAHSLVMLLQQLSGSVAPPEPLIFRSAGVERQRFPIGSGRSLMVDRLDAAVTEAEASGNVPPDIIAGALRTLAYLNGDSGNTREGYLLRAQASVAGTEYFKALAEVSRDLAWLRFEQGRYEESLGECNDALAALERWSGESPGAERVVEVSRTRMLHAWAQASLIATTHSGDFSQPLRELDDVARELERQFGDDSRDVALARTLRAVVQLAEGREPTALHSFQLAAKTLSIQDGPESLFAAWMEYQKGESERKKGNLKEAVLRFRIVYLRVRTLLGENHPVTSLAQGALAGGLEQFARSVKDSDPNESEEAIKEAIVQVRGALAAARRSPLCGQPAMIIGLEELGRVLSSRDSADALQEAAAVLGEAWAYSTLRSGPNDSRSLALRGKLEAALARAPHPERFPSLDGTDAQNPQKWSGAGVLLRKYN